MKFQDIKYCDSKKDLLDYIFSDKTINSETILNNSDVIKKLSSEVQEFTDFKDGIKLITIELNKDRHHILLASIDKTDDKFKYSPKYSMLSGIEKTSIDLPFSIQVHQSDKIITVGKRLMEIRSNAPIHIKNNIIDIISYATVDTLEGHEFSIQKFEEGIKTFTINKEASYISSQLLGKQVDVNPLAHHLNDIISTVYNEAKDCVDTTLNQINMFIERSNIPEITVDIRHQTILNAVKNKEELHLVKTPVSERNMMERGLIFQLNKIQNVRRLNNTRVADVCQVKGYLSNTGELAFYDCGSYQIMINVGSDSLVNIDNKGYSAKGYIYEQYNSRDISSRFVGVPFNYVDEGRMFIEIFSQNREYQRIYSNDPAIDAEYETKFKELIVSMFNAQLTNIKICDYKIDQTKYSLFSGIKNIEGDKQSILKELKSSFDEFTYLYKRDRITDESIKITDKIEYNPKIGKIKIDNFMIETIDPIISSGLINDIKYFVKQFFDRELNEQQIIDKLLAKYFDLVGRSIERKKPMNTPYDLKDDAVKTEQWVQKNKHINIKLNDIVNLTIKCGIGGNSFCYINDTRFNINEIVPVFKEIICYQNQQTSDQFVEMVGKLGLSTFIGITSGYVVGSRIYKFKKTKGRSNYELMIGDVVIKLQGKDVINHLYKSSLAALDAKATNTIAENKVFDCIIDYEDYIKFKFLINKSYDEYIKKSHQFLIEKVEESGATIVEYIDKHRGVKKDAVYLSGLSGNKYAIVYDSNESFIFMNPQTHTSSTDEKEVLTEGNYICMIDQSSVKSKIGYDTVISKLFALKNDSIVAQNIYNLKDELE